MRSLHLYKRVCLSVGRSVGRSVGHTQVEFQRLIWVEFDQNSIRNKIVCHLKDDSKTSTRAVRQRTHLLSELCSTCSSLQRWFPISPSFSYFSFFKFSTSSVLSSSVLCMSFLPVSVCPSVCPSVCLCVSVSLSVCLSVSLSLSLSHFLPSLLSYSFALVKRLS